MHRACISFTWKAGTKNSLVWTDSEPDKEMGKELDLDNEELTKKIMNDKLINQLSKI